MKTTIIISFLLAIFIPGMCLAITTPSAPSGLGIPDFNNVSDLIRFLVNILLSVIGLVLVILLIMDGIFYMTTNDKTKRADRIGGIVMRFIGLVIIVFSIAITNTIIKTLTSTGNTPPGR